MSRGSIWEWWAMINPSRTSPGSITRSVAVVTLVSPCKVQVATSKTRGRKKYEKPSKVKGKGKL